jgi:hypothetical protein
MSLPDMESLPKSFGNDRKVGAKANKATEADCFYSPFRGLIFTQPGHLAPGAAERRSGSSRFVNQSRGTA